VEAQATADPKFARVLGGELQYRMTDEVPRMSRAFRRVTGTRLVTGSHLPDREPSVTLRLTTHCRGRATRIRDSLRSALSCWRAPELGIRWASLGAALEILR
jgi:hypothetical protein